MPEIVNGFDILDEYWSIISCPYYYIEGDSTTESEFFDKGHSDKLVIFLMIKVKRHIRVLASGLLTIPGFGSTIRVSSNCH